MQVRIATFIIAGFLVGCAQMIAPSREEINNADYGFYPTDYKEMVQRYIDDNFYDPYSVKDLEINQPVKYFVQEPPLLGGRRYFGYLVSFCCNAKNQMGGYAGKTWKHLLARDGEFIKDITDVVKR